MQLVLDFPYDIYYNEYINLGGTKSAKEYMKLIEIVQLKIFTKDEFLTHKSMEKGEIYIHKITKNT